VPSPRSLYERKHEPLLPRREFLARVGWHALLAGSIVGAALGLGVLGYHAVAGLAWIDALLDAAMILTGMGPVSTMRTDAAKVFASAYALFSGLALTTTMGILLAPAVHRMLHHLHLEEPRAGESADD
jgi:hypothetical protein